MTEKERKELREFYQKEYFVKTGINLLCVEHNEKHPSKFKKVCCEHILDISAKYWNLSVDDLTERCRRRFILYKRRMTIAVMRSYGMSCTSIGNVFGQDHTTVIWAEEVHKNMLESNEDYRSSWMEFNKHCIDKITKIQNSIDGHIEPEQEPIISKGETVIVKGDYINCSPTIPDVFKDTAASIAPPSSVHANRKVLNYLCSPDLFYYCTNGTNMVINGVFNGRWTEFLILTLLCVLRRMTCQRLLVRIQLTLTSHLVLERLIHHVSDK